jgi:hypothetical protein
MSELEIIYYSGVIVSVLIGLVSLTISDDEHCTINHIECILINILLSSLSWLMVTAYTLGIIRDKYITKDNK